MKQALAEATLQTGNRLRDGRFGEIELDGGAGKGAGFGYFRENRPGFKIGEVPAIGRYHADASSVSFRTSTVYGLKTLAALGRYVLHRAGFRSPWLTPTSDADKQALPVGQVAHHSQV